MSMRLIASVVYFVCCIFNASQGQTLDGVLLWNIPDPRQLHENGPELRVISLGQRIYRHNRWITTNSSHEIKALEFSIKPGYSNGKLLPSASTIEIHRTDLRKTDTYLAIILDYRRKLSDFKSYVLLCTENEHACHAYNIHFEGDNDTVKRIYLRRFNKQWIRNYVAQSDVLKYESRVAGPNGKTIEAIAGWPGDIHVMFDQIFAHRDVAVLSEPSSKLYPNTKLGHNHLAEDRSDKHLENLAYGLVGLGIMAVVAKASDSISNAKEVSNNRNTHPTHKLVTCETCEGKGKIWKIARGECLRCGGAEWNGDIRCSCSGLFALTPGESLDYRWVPCETCKEHGQRWVPK